MVLGEPWQRVAGMAGQEFRDRAQTVNVRRHSSETYRRLFPPAERSGAGEKPSGKEMGYRAHVEKRTAGSGMLAHGENAVKCP